MAKFLIDANLPYYFNLWNQKDYIHQIDIDPSMKDKDIWDYAEAQKLTIVTKDSDFSNRILFKEPPPRVIHIRLGNMKMKAFHEVLNQVWEEVLEMSKSYKLVNVYRDKIEGIE